MTCDRTKTRSQRAIEILEIEGSIDDFHAMNTRLTLRLAMHVHLLRRKECVIETKERNYPPSTFERRFCGLRWAQARMLTMTLKGFAPLSRAVSIVVRTSASASAAHMAR
jgi:hypothetical protein